jgi:DNA polymerase-2
LSLRVKGERAFLLTRQWRDSPEGIELVFWARGESGPLRVRFEGQEAVCFAPRGINARSLDADVRALDLSTLEGTPVDGLYFPSQRSLVAARRHLRASGLHVFESDIKPSDRYLMERFVTGGFEVEGSAVEHEGFREYRNPRLVAAEFRPTLRVVSIDIETAGFDGDLYSICASSEGDARVFLLRSDEWDESVHGDRIDEQREHAELTVHHDQKTLLEEFFAWLNVFDPDVLIGWNVIDFDLHFLERACRRLDLPFAVGRGRDRAALLSPSKGTGKRVARIPGRAVLDGIDTLRNATWNFEDFGLEAVSRELLGRGKLIAPHNDRVAEIQRLYRDEPWELVRYNVEDCRLVEEIFEEAKLIDFALERSRLTGLPLDRVGGSVAAFDNLYLPRLHRRGRVARDVEERALSDMSPGGYVMDSNPGLFDNVLVLDFKSLYPSIIRTFRIDPLGLAVAGEDAVPGFRGAAFSRDEHILPELIEELWRARDRAKREGNEPLSRTIKILMNSFYGVLGTPGCRFFEPRLVSSVTLRGHEIIHRSRTFLEDAGYTVIYGDTDSLFVLLGTGPSESECEETGRKLAAGLNRFWAEYLRRELDLESFLELQFERHYVRFFMPTIRGSELGSKKRYAGLVRRGGKLELHFTGLEAVRSDWTPLAREFQRELYRRILHDEPYEDYVRRTADDLFAGRRDRDLVYRKRLRRRLEDYTKNVPPHAQAARKSTSPGRWVRYVVTLNGPEPLDNNPSPFDYQHYLDRQIAPAGDALLHVKGTSVAKILDQQLSLF